MYKFINLTVGPALGGPLKFVYSVAPDKTHIAINSCIILGMVIPRQYYILLSFLVFY
jgi:hypothetical protein